MEIKERILGYVIMNGKLWGCKKYRANLRTDTPISDQLEEHADRLMKLHGLDKKNKAIERHNKKYPHDKKELYKIEFRTRLKGGKPIKPTKKRAKDNNPSFQFRSFDEVKIKFA
jgi:hypothetical protein